MEDDIVVAGVEMMTVGDPIAGAGVDLDIPGLESRSLELKGGTGEIGTEAVAPSAVENDVDSLTGDRDQGARETAVPGGAHGELARTRCRGT
jgi:hypothetical protein